MCGILGVLPAVEENKFINALSRITHRGPDGYGVWNSSNKSATLGHRRLAILDLSELGKQPMSFNNLTITFNGEIYNFLEIKKELILNGFTFSSQSDTEVILKAYLHWGVECFLKFNGMWALAIFNNSSGELLLSRDRFGKKPLYYSFYKGGFYFASEMKAITPFFDSIELSDDFAWCNSNHKVYESTEKCLIKGIKRFPAGCYALLNLKNQKLNITAYWNTLDHLVSVPISYDDQVEKYQEILIDACKIRMRSDVKIGTSLSGGVDSSSLVGLIANIGKQHHGDRISNDWQNTVVAAFPGHDIDETKDAVKVANYVGIEPTIVNINEISSSSKLENYIGQIEELVLTNPIPMVEIYAKMRQLGIIVTLDGHGADELLSGYHYSLYEAFYDCNFNISKMFDIVKTRLATLPNSKEHESIFKCYYDILFYFARNFGVSTVSALSKLNLMNEKRQLPAERPKYIQKLGKFNSYLFDLFHRTSMPVHLRNYDRYSMISGVEIRMPFMDHRLVEYSFSLPWDSKIRNGYTKSILRDAAKNFVPHDVIFRKNKVGFGSPMLHLFKNDWKEYLQDLVHENSFNQSQTLSDPAYVRNKILAIYKNENASFAHAQKAFQLVVPYIWEKKVIKEKFDF